MSNEELGSAIKAVKGAQDKLERLTGLRDMMQSAIDNNRSEEAWASSINLYNALEAAVTAANEEIEALEKHIESLNN